MQKIDFVNATHPAINDTNLNKMQDNIETAINAQVSGDTLPLGAILPFPGGTIPENYLLCDGSAVSRTTYALLFNVIGTTYGEGDGSTTFNLPDMRSRTLVGVDTRDSNLNAVGKTYGEKNHTMTVSEMPEHSHPTQHYAVGTNARNYRAYEGGIASGQSDVYYATADTNNTGGGQPFNVMQPSMATNYIIKAFQTAGVVAQVVNQQTSSSTNVYSADYINKMFAFTKTYTYMGSDMSSNNGTVQSYSSISIHVNTLGTLAYAEGTLYNNHSTSGAATVTFNSALRPSSSKSALNIQTVYNNASTGENMAIETSGKVTMQVYGTAGGNSRHTIIPTLIWL